MGAAVPLRTDFSAGELRQLAKRAEDADQARRLLSLAAVLPSSRAFEVLYVTVLRVLLFGFIVRDLPADDLAIERQGLKHDVEALAVLVVEREPQIEPEVILPFSVDNSAAEAEIDAPMPSRLLATARCQYDQGNSSHWRERGF
jgi:hypothetical protein